MEAYRTVAFLRKKEVKNAAGVGRMFGNFVVVEFGVVRGFGFKADDVDVLELVAIDF